MTLTPLDCPASAEKGSVSIIFLLVGLPFVVIGIWSLRSNRFAAREWKRVPGVVAGYVKRHVNQKSAASLYPVIRIQHLGKRYFVEGPVGSAQPTYALGQRMDAFVDESDPPQVSVMSRASILFGWFFVIMGAIPITIFFFTFSLNLFSLIPAALILGRIAWSLSRPGVRDKIQKFSKFDYSKILYKVAVPEAELREKFNLMPPELIRQTFVRQYKQMRYVGVVFCLLGIAASTGSFRWHEKRETFLLSAQKAPGEIVRFHYSTDSDGTTYYPVVQYRHPASGNIEFKHNVGSSHPSRSIGDEVTVLYSEQDAKDAMIDGGFWNHAVPLIVLTLSILLTLLGLYYVVRRTPYFSMQIG